jgi:hexokinase
LFFHSFKMEQRLRQAIEEGLDAKRHSVASVKCFPTYVRQLPSGCEVGKFLALDLGGTNFRVVLMEIGPKQK